MPKRLYVYLTDEPLFNVSVEDEIVAGPFRAVVVEDGRRKEAALYFYLEGEVKRDEDAQEHMLNPEIRGVVIDEDYNHYSIADFDEAIFHLG